MTQARSAARACAFALAASIAFAAAAPSAEPAKVDASSATHKEDAVVKVIGTDGQTRLQTLSVDGEGRILALVAPPRGYGAPTKNASGEVHVFSAEGKPVMNWKVGFHAQSINAGPDGKVFVAGDGRVARFGKDGKALDEIQLPHVAELLKDKEGMRKKAEAQLKAQKDSFTTMVKQFKERKETIEKKKEDERTNLEKTQLKQFDEILKSYEESAKFYETRKVDDVVNEIAGRLRIINSVAVSARDVFIACGESQGYGYAVWRLDLDLKNPKQVLSAIGGCCGQMDVQVAGEDILVAENTKHQFARYTREGKKVGSYGKRGPETDIKCFGGCCNPMNVRAATGGDVYTAESEGVVKRFSDKGEFIGLVGVAKLQGGCKNVAVGVSPDASRVYFCDQPGSRIIILAKKADK